MMVWKMIFLFNWVIFRFHVNLPGCNPFWAAKVLTCLFSPVSTSVRQIIRKKNKLLITDQHLLEVDDNSYKTKKYPPYFSSPNHLREMSPNHSPPQKKHQKTSNILPKNIFKNIRPKNIPKKNLPTKIFPKNPSKKIPPQKCPQKNGQTPNLLPLEGSLTVGEAGGPESKTPELPTTAELPRSWGFGEAARIFFGEHLFRGVFMT